VTFLCISSHETGLKDTCMSLSLKRSVLTRSQQSQECQDTRRHCFCDSWAWPFELKINWFPWHIVEDFYVKFGAVWGNGSCHMGPRNHVLDRGSRFLTGMGNFGGCLCRGVDSKRDNSIINNGTTCDAAFWLKFFDHLLHCATPHKFPYH